MPPRKKILFGAVLVAMAAVLAFGAAELILRFTPIPGIGYHSTRYDPLTGGTLYPNSTVWYRGARGEFVKRRVNDWGFLDVSHEVAKPPGMVRIGFFGDSYTEAAQVPIAETFFRLVEDELNERIAAGTIELTGRGGPARRVETLAFGISGRSALQSFLECSRWMDRLDLDYVVYVFCENDISDQIRDLNPSPGIPYAYLDGDSFAVDDSFRRRMRRKTSWWHRWWQWSKAHSLVLSTLESRLKLLVRHGVKTHTTRDDMQMEATGGGARGGAFVRGRGTGPSAWRSDSLLTYSETLFRRVLDAWRHDVAAAGRRFVVLYVPKERHMDQPIAAQDSWAGWIHDYCREHAVALVDPSAELVARRDRGEEVFHDHFTPAGHRAVAEAFVDVLAAVARGNFPVSTP